jgi:3-deoxy-D-manno-octulosonic-acid transferase
MMLWLYRGAAWFATPILRRHLERRIPLGKEDAGRIRERYGIASLPRPSGRLGWLHAASLGETQSLMSLIGALGAREPNLSLLVTTGTVSAARLLERYALARTLHQYLPLDRQAWVENFLAHWRPDFALWVESEFWPILLDEAARRAVPLALVNGRISTRSFACWRLAGPLIRQLLAGFAVVLAQDETHAQRLAALGARTPQALGNLKFTADPLPVDEDALRAMKAQVAGRTLWLAASTHSGEDAIMAAAHRKLAPRHPRLLTVIVPRHAERGSNIAARLAADGFQLARRSLGEAITESTEIYLADTMGELGLFYRLAPVALVAGSYRWQGHNPIEPALLGAALLSGPRIGNFLEIYRRMVAASAVKIAAEDELPDAIDWALAEAEEAGRRAREFAESERTGILENVLAALAPVIHSSRNARA